MLRSSSCVPHGGLAETFRMNPARGFSTILRSDGFSDYSERLLAGAILGH
jgi:hypothetical protein